MNEILISIISMTGLGVLFASVLAVELARKLEMVGNAHEEGKAFALGDEIQVRHAEERPVLIERDLSG